MEKRTGSPCKTPSALGLQVIQRYLSLQLVNQPHQGMQLVAASRSFAIPALSPTLSGYQRQAGDMAGHQILIRYRQAQIQSISMGKLLAANDADLRELIHDRIVLVGYAAGDSDRHLTPLGKRYGIAIHAQVISQMLDGLLGHPPASTASTRSLITALPDWAEVMMIGVWSLLGSWIAWRWRSGWLWVVLLIATLAMIGLSIISFQELLWLPIMAFSGSLYLAVLMIYLIKLGLRFNRSSIN